MRMGLKQSLALVLAAALGLAVPAFAHSPHHVIDDLEISSDYANDTTLFVLVHNYLLRSTDRAGTWQPLVNGIDTPHILTDIAVSANFAADGSVFVASAGDGVFRSADRGNTWQRFNAGLTRYDIGKLHVVHGDAGAYVLAAGSWRGLFLSPAGGADWFRVLSDDVQVTALAHMDIEGETTLFAGDSRGGLWRSGPGLRDWRRIANVDTLGAITVLRSEAGRGGLLVGTAESGLVRMSVDGEITQRLDQRWPRSSVNCGAKLNREVRDIATDGARILFTTWSDALYASGDDGASWEVLDAGLRCDKQADDARFGTPHFREVAISASDWFIGSFEGLFRSADQGNTWVPLETLPVWLVRGMGISGDKGGRHDLLVTTYGGGAYLTSDRGETWTVMNAGLVTTRLSDAELPESLYTLSRGRLLSSPGPGRAWTPIPLADQSWLARASAKLFGPPAESSAWPMHIELSPNFADDATMLLGFRRAGVWISDDGGASWQRDWNGPTDYTTDMKISPDFANDGTVFAAFRGAGIHVTRDRAVTWQASNDGFENFADHHVRRGANYRVDPPLSRAISDALLAISPDYARDRTVFAGSAAGLFRSTDAGETWESIGEAPVTGLAVSPAYARDRTVLVSLRGRGLFLSTDGGQSFAPTGAGLLAASVVPEYLAFSPTFESDNVIYAASNWSFWVSGDAGANWVRVPMPVRYEDFRGDYEGPVWFSDRWQREFDAGLSASRQTATEQTGATASLWFTGTRIGWYGERGPRGGKARVYINGVEAGVVDLSAGEVSTGARVFDSGVLGAGLHEIVVEALEGRVTIDYFDVVRDHDAD